MKLLRKSAHHNTFIFSLNGQHELIVTSDFDSGNLEQL
jgi:hypothetical protein